ncbi:MAG: hypothetical protein Q4C04_04365 [Clostridia bacterium]|nr:hypothetical protein [Clostridia bacterium]
MSNICIRCGAELPEALEYCAVCAACLDFPMTREVRPLRWPCSRLPESFDSISDFRGWAKVNKSPFDVGDVAHFLSQNIPSESWYQTQIKAKLSAELPGAVISKTQQSIYSASGQPDLTIVYKGLHIALEIKRPLLGTPTALQKQYIKRLRDAGAIAYVVRSVIEADMIVRLIKIKTRASDI